MSVNWDINDVVVLKVDLPAEGLKKGMVGTIVHLFFKPVIAYETELCNDYGETTAQVPLLPEQIEPYQGE